MRKNNIKVEILRIIACFAVIWYHIRELPWKTNGELYDTAVFFETICTVCVMLFFLISGFYIYDKKGNIFCDWIRLIKNYLIRIFIPFLFFAGIATVFGDYFISTKTINECICSFDINKLFNTLYISVKTFSVNNLHGVVGHLWYIYSYFTILLAYPIVRFILRNIKRRFVYLLLLSVFLLMIVNDIHLFFGDPSYNTFFERVPKPIFYSAFGYLLFKDFMIPLIDAKKSDNNLILNKKVFVIAILVYSITFIAIFMTQRAYCLRAKSLNEIAKYQYVYTSWLSFYSLVFTSAFALAVYNINFDKIANNTIVRIINYISKRTLGIYFIHYFIITKLLSIGFQGKCHMNFSIIFQYFAYYVLYSLLIFLISMFIICIYEIILFSIKLLFKKIILSGGVSYGNKKEV